MLFTFVNQLLIYRTLLNFGRNSITAGWFLTEFHIAHEEVVNGRKKYIIPLMLDKIKPSEIQDADLRMYVESHTYLDCKNKVILIVPFWSTRHKMKFSSLLEAHYDCLLCFAFGTNILNIMLMSDPFLLQQNLRKRLEFAMPRVPLQKLKVQKNSVIKEEADDLSEAADTKVGILAKRILEASKSKLNVPPRMKMPLGGDKDEPDLNENITGQTKLEDSSASEGAVALDRPFGEKCVLNRQEYGNLFKQQHVKIDEEDVEMMQRLEARIQMKNRRLNLRVVVVEGDTENILGRDDKNINGNDEGQEQLSFTEGSTGTEVEVEAIVHKEETSEAWSNDDLEDQLMQNNNTQAKKCFGKKIKPRGGTKPKQMSRWVRREQNMKTRGSKNSRKKLQKTDEYKTQKTTQVTWGLEDSSESDGGWDCGKEDLPLLPR